MFYVIRVAARSVRNRNWEFQLYIFSVDPAYIFLL